MAARIKSNLPSDHRLASLRGELGDIYPNMSEDPENKKFHFEFVPRNRHDTFCFVNVSEFETDHYDDIYRMRNTPEDVPDYLEMQTAAALLELHDRTGISLDNFGVVREFVEKYVGHSITPNGV